MIQVTDEIDTRFNLVESSTKILRNMLVRGNNELIIAALNILVLDIKVLGILIESQQIQGN